MDKPSNCWFSEAYLGVRRYAPILVRLLQPLVNDSRAQIGFGSGALMPSSTRRGLRMASGRPVRGGAGTCLVTSTNRTPPANLFETWPPSRSQKPLVFNQNFLLLGG